MSHITLTYMLVSSRRYAVILWITAVVVGLFSLESPGFAQTSEEMPKNVVFILSDDHRYDFMSFMEGAPDFLETPAMDRMAAEGAHLSNAFVTTSLCSPSRASILTGQYAHRHGVVDNSTRVPEGTVFFPEYLQKAGYQTAFFGKWHMGRASAEPRPGFDQWVSFRGQGSYFNPTLNINGQERQVEGYTTDILTHQALNWLGQQREESDKPFFLYLSHKSVHAEFKPAPRHKGRYGEEKVPHPPSMANTEANYRNRPEWVREQRYSWHGVDYMYHGDMKFDGFYRRYAETLLALDESIGQVMDYLEKEGLAENTLVIYMGDNGFMLGEHGLIDKRHAYEESIRVPMLAWSPGFLKPETKIDGLVRNIDIAPTVLELAGLQKPKEMDGRSVMPLLQGQSAEGDRELLYEYYWEYAFPQTPTVFALRGDRYKLMMYHGVWDMNEFYDLKTDPNEMHNLIDVPAYQDTIRAFQKRLWQRMKASDGMQIPLRPMGGWQAAEKQRHAE